MNWFFLIPQCTMFQSKTVKKVYLKTIDARVRPCNGCSDIGIVLFTLSHHKVQVKSIAGAELIWLLLNSPNIKAYSTEAAVLNNEGQWNCPAPRKVFSINRATLNTFQDQLFRSRALGPPYHYLIAVYLFRPWVLNDVLFFCSGWRVEKVKHVWVWA